MTRDPIRRRFGRGAARLRLGLPAGAERLAELARTKVRLERRLTLVPFLTAIAVIGLLATSPPIARRAAAPQPSELEIELELQAWPTHREPLPIPPNPAMESHAEASTVPTRASAPRSSPPAATSPDTTEPRPDTARAAAADTRREANPASRFDPSALATRGAAWRGSDVLAGSAAATVSTPRFEGARNPRALPAEVGPLVSAEARALARAARTGQRGQPTRTLPAAPDSARPGRTDRSGVPSRALVEAASAGARARRAELAVLEAGGGGRERGGARPVAPRPAVSAARAPQPALESDGTGGGSDSGLAGWEEVPLDALPDCDPPGRQDLLKKRILLAASVQRECSHASGSYRFVETRSLGGFLMGSRPGPNAGARQPRDRDACDVLERALACLGDRSSQESQSR